LEKTDLKGIGETIPNQSQYLLPPIGGGNVKTFVKIGNAD